MTIRNIEIICKSFVYFFDHSALAVVNDDFLLATTSSPHSDVLEDYMNNFRKKTCSKYFPIIFFAEVLSHLWFLVIMTTKLMGWIKDRFRLKPRRTMQP